MHLKVLAISDTHIGEDSSLLSFPAGRQELWRVLRETFSLLDRARTKDSPRFEVDEFVMIGDIPDRTLSSTSEILTHVSAFIEMLGSAATIKRGVYVPGNHDHTMWTDYSLAQHGEYAWSTPPSGELLIRNGQRQDTDAAGEEYLAMFFGYPGGASWRTISETPLDFDFVLANPLYATRVGSRTYVFTHGTHFRKLDVCLSPGRKRRLWTLARLLYARHWLGLNVDPNCDVRRPQDLPGLEEEVQRFVDSLWPSPGNEPVGASDQLYYLMCILRGYGAHRRPAPPRSRLFSRDVLPQASPHRIQRLTPEDSPVHESLASWQEFFRSHMLAYLEAHGVPTDELTFVYGDTHTGGWGELPHPNGQPTRIYNTGTWIVDHEGNHPPCQLFAVDDSGQEYLLDVSFRKITVSGESIVGLAASAAEHRHRNTSRVVKWLLSRLP